MFENTHGREYAQVGPFGLSPDQLAGIEPLPNSIAGRRHVRKVGHTQHHWRVDDDVIYLLTWSDGTKATSWANMLSHAGYDVLRGARAVFRNNPFTATADVVRKIAILKGRHVLRCHTIDEVRKKFKKHSLLQTHPEAACLLRLDFTEVNMQEMNLSHIVVAHDPVTAMRQRFVLGRKSLGVCEAHDPIDLGQQGTGIAFLVEEYAFPRLVAA